jgi:hypothetical protein
MKIQSGKYYLDGYDDVIGPMQRRWGRGSPYTWHDTSKPEGADSIYRPDGRFHADAPGDRDLLKEVPGATPDLRIKAGKFYRNRAGDVIGPMQRRDSTRYPWMSSGAANPGDHLVYRDNGRIWLNGLAGPDLVEEVPAPAKVAKKPSQTWAVLIKLPNKSRREAREVRNKLAKWGFKAVVCVDLA